MWILGLQRLNETDSIVSKIDILRNFKSKTFYFHPALTIFHYFYFYWNTQREPLPRLELLLG